MSLDLGRLRATDYKYNKYIHLPKPESVNRESVHEVRKDQMLSVFREIKSEASLGSTNKSSGALRRINSKKAARGKTQIRASKRDLLAEHINNKKGLPAEYLNNERDLPAKYSNTLDQDDSNERDLPAKYSNTLAQDDSNERGLPAQYMNTERDLPAKYSNTLTSEVLNERDSPAKYCPTASTMDDERDSPAKYCPTTSRMDDEYGLLAEDYPTNSRMNDERDSPAKYYNVQRVDNKRHSPTKYCGYGRSKNVKDVRKKRDRMQGVESEENKHESNLSEQERAGLTSLQKRVASGELVVTETDKSKRFSILRAEQYYASGQKHVKDDVIVDAETVSKLQKTVNDHCHWLGKIFNIGANWEHTERITQSMCDKGEVVAPLYLLIKDHKGWREGDGIPPPSRPVCSGNKGYNRHLSEILSLVLEPVGHSLGGFDIESTNELLKKVEELNIQLQEENMGAEASKRVNDSEAIARGSINDEASKEEECKAGGRREKERKKKKKKPSFNIDMKEMRVKNLRKMKLRGSNVPNIKSRLWALRLLDEVSNNEVITLPERTQTEGDERERIEKMPAEPVPPMQSNSMTDYAVVGTDVEALFPSLKDLESARIARDAVILSKAQFENVNFELALRYLVVTGGQCHVKECGLGALAPRWLGTRPDLLSVGGDSIGEDAKWTRVKREMSEEEKRIIISRVIETAVVVCMNTHIYRFGNNLYLQQSGGPIGMRFTAALANIVMKMWDLTWIKLMKREKMEWNLYLRYVDDCR